MWAFEMALEINNKEYFEEVLAFADKVGLRAQLDEKLKCLDEYAEHGDRGKTRCHLSPDLAPHSFGFVIERRVDDDDYQPWFVGGLILHGAHDNSGDGSFPTLAVSMNPTVGWQIHT